MPSSASRDNARPPAGARATALLTGQDRAQELLRLRTREKAALEKKKYPLVVSEGDSRGKSERIGASSYLSYCRRKFENMQGSLFLYGSSLSPQDDHIWDAIALNTGLPRLFVGIRGSPSSQRNLQLADRATALAARRKQVLVSGRRGGRAKKEDLGVLFFDAETANVWSSGSYVSPKAA